MARNPNYPREHDLEREAWVPAVASGLVECRRGASCLAPKLLIDPDEPWDLGHPDAACPAPKAPEHRRCNRATATHKAQAGRRKPEVHPALRALAGDA